MKQDVVKYLHDSFVDFKGQTHDVVICALSTTPESDLDHEYKTCWVNKCELLEDSLIVRMVTLGISVCNPEDKFDLERGKRNAYNRALNDSNCPTIFANLNGIINDSLVDAFMKQEMGYILDNPERVIKGYNDAKKRWEANSQKRLNDKIKALEEIKHLTSEELVVLNALKQNVDIDKCKRLVKYAV